MAQRFVLDWRRLSRWALLGAIIMLLWLLAPVVQCSWHVFADTPIGAVDPDTAAPSDHDQERVREGLGFWSRFGGGVQRCYARTPLLEQEAWKSNLLIGLAIAALLARIVAYAGARRRRTFGDP